MNKYHYHALINLILACTLIILAGQFYMGGEKLICYAFSGLSTLQLLGYLRNEHKANKQ